MVDKLKNITNATIISHFVFHTLAEKKYILISPLWFPRDSFCATGLVGLKHVEICSMAVLPDSSVVIQGDLGLHSVI